MANQLTANPIYCDTGAGAGIISSVEGELVQAIQWVDDPDADFTTTDHLTMVINGVTLKFIVTVAATQLSGVTAYEIIFPQPIRIHSLVLTTIDAGALIIWKA
jgi:hypothetical protein